jgi:hypothetical protein
VSPTAPARTAADLWEAVADLKEARLAALEKYQHEEAERKAKAQAAAYTKRLDQLAAREEESWAKISEWIATKRPHDYDLAVSLLADLQAIAERRDDEAAFRRRFSELRDQHQRKPSLLERFVQAGLPR